MGAAIRMLLRLLGEQQPNRGIGMYWLRGIYGLVLLPFLLQTKQANSAAVQSPPLAPSQSTQSTTIPMLDEGKGLIHLDVSVTNGDGEPVLGLIRKDFELLDEGHPQKIRSFHAFTGRSASISPARIILFIDTLQMPNIDASRLQLGVEQFLRHNGGQLEQPVSIFGLSADGFWTLPLHDTTDGNALVASLTPQRKVLLSRRQDALRALGFIAAEQRRKRGRKVMLWIGPGCGTGTGIFPVSSKLGQKTFNLIYWLRMLVREARLSIDELSIDQANSCAPEYQEYLSGPRTVHEADTRFLYKKLLAIQSGGRVMDYSNSLAAEMNRSARGALTYYTLSYDPPFALQDHEYHSLTVRVARAGLQARTETDYFDEVYFSDHPTLAGRQIKTEEGAFLHSSPAEMSRQPAPDEAAQQRMLSLVIDYLDTTIPKLPDFYATRTTVRYEDQPLFDSDTFRVSYKPIHAVETSKARVLYHQGQEVIESQGDEPDESWNRYLITHGTFGPLLARVRDWLGKRGRMEWVRWEISNQKALAVFEFEVSAADSTDFEGGCCLPDAEGQESFRKQAGYRIEMSIDPSNGTIFRLQQRFDMHEYVPEDRDEVVIEYGPVSIGHKTYFCPIRSVSVAKGRSIISLSLWDQSFLSYGPYSIKFNDMRFSGYHLFHAESHMLPGFKTTQ
jgi:VWFA-related protein